MAGTGSANLLKFIERLASGRFTAADIDRTDYEIMNALALVHAHLIHRPAEPPRPAAAANPPAALHPTFGQQRRPPPSGHPRLDGVTGVFPLVVRP